MQGDGTPQARRAGAAARHFTPQRARRMLERLGPTFVKVGQFLALRPDVVAQEYCDEFMQLTDRIAPFEYADAKRIIEEDLGKPLEALFSWINPRPAGAGALAQVHAARTLAGDEVAIKVQRPDVRRKVERDLARVRLLGRILAIARVSPIVSIDEVVAELARWMKDELDCAQELRNIQRMHELCRDLGGARIPRPLPALCGERVVTTELLSGTPLTEVLALVRAGDRGRLAALGINPERVAANLLETVLEQVFAKEFFHADIHPGNLFALPGNVVGFVDFGLADSLSPHFRQAILEYLGTVNSGEIDRMFDGLVGILISSESSDLPKLRADFFEVAGRWLRDRTQKVDQRGSATSRFLVAVLRSAREHRFRVPPAILSIYRSLLAAESIAHGLGSRRDLADVARPLFERLQFKAVLDTFALQNLQSVGLDVLGLLRDGPRRIGRLLAEVVDGRLVLRIRTVDSAEDRRLANARARLIALAAVSIGLAFLTGSTREMRLLDVLPVPWVIWTAIAGAWLGIVYQWRNLR